MTSLRTRLLVTVGVMAVAAVAAVALSARVGTRVEFQRFQAIERMHGTGDSKAALERAVSALDGKCCTAQMIAAAQSAAGRGQALLVLDAAGAIRAASGFDADASQLRARYGGGLLEISSADRRAGSSTEAITGLSLTIRGVQPAPIVLLDGGTASLFVVALPGERDQPALTFQQSVDRHLLTATALVAGLSLAFTWVFARRLVRPIGELRDAARDLARGDLSRRVSTKGASEVAELGRAFNAMAADLERQQTLRRNLVHDVAHELRTPLTDLRCRIEAAIDGLTPDPKPALSQMHEEVAHLSRLVSDLDELARAEAGEIALAMGIVSLAEVCRSAIRSAGLESDPRVRTELDTAVTARGDAVRVRQIVLNLLTNADRHTPAGGIITVRVLARSRDAVIEVHNTGSALTPEEIDHVFDRFYRADPSRQRATGGSGLGLAIVKHLTEAQGGRVWASSDASGVVFGVALATGR